MVGTEQTCNPADSGRTIRYFRNRKTEYRSDGDVRNFQRVSMLPTLDDLREERPFLKPNIVDGAYTDVWEYLGTQFHLLREDYVAPLRNGIQMYRQVYLDGFKMNRGTLKRIEGVNFYVDAYFDTPTRYRLPPALVVLRLSWPDYNFVNWDRTTRLKAGCLLGISNDNFTNAVFAVVSQKQTPSLLKRGVLIVEFFRKFVRPRPEDKWLIIENASAYFEAYRHNLKALQMMDPARFPLQRYLAKAERAVRAPAFLRPDRALSFAPIMNESVSIFKRSSHWPRPEETVLNDQQYEAIKSAFSRELCVIQGPPGTGKTFVALRIVEMLLLNRVSNRPILVVCYTNHALDQFLEGMLLYTKDMVRVGGASKSEKLKEFTLKELLEGSNEEKKALRQLESDRDECERRLDQLSGHAILGDDEITFGKEKLENFLGLNFAGSAVSGNGSAVSKKPERDPNFLKDHDRGQIEKRNISSVSQRLLARQVSESQRAVVHSNLGGPKRDQPKKKRLAQIRKKVETGFPASIAERWTLYRHEHWTYIRTWAASYVKKCSNLTESKGIFKSQKSSAQMPSRENLIQKASAILKRRVAELDALISRYSKKARKANRDKQKEKLVRSKRVVGMTTTGAAKFNFLVHAAQPEIVIVEEAAEVLEAHLLASLVPSTKQLILIGDHQQLQPSTAVHRLAEEFRMEVSLFERLVKNEISFVRLNEQHRMRDEFLCLLVPHIYGNYFSHNDVDKYPNVRGIASNMFFMTHSHNELSDPHTHSKSNTFEAGIAVRLAYHLLQNDYNEKEITILATYRGQVAAIEEEITKFCDERGFTEMHDVEVFQQGANGKKEIAISRVPMKPGLPISPFEGMRVTTVDNYQGEENKIVIVSFVRSNDEAKIGFLSRENRVCVAMSRAKHGLYCIGNIALLSKASTLWAEISRVLTEKSRIGEGLTLVCKGLRHRGEVKTAKEFDQWNRSRGCGKICGDQLPCGHVCKRACHVDELGHEGKYACKQKCSKLHPCGHPCVKLCGQACGKCVTRTKRTRDCGHTVKEPCGQDPDKSLCRETIEWIPPCGHSRTIACGLTKSNNLPCGKPLTYQRPCGHPFQAPCDSITKDESCGICEIQTSFSESLDLRMYSKL